MLGPQASPPANVSHQVPLSSKGQAGTPAVPAPAHPFDRLTSFVARELVQGSAQLLTLRRQRLSKSRSCSNCGACGCRCGCRRCRWLLHRQESQQTDLDLREQLTIPSSSHRATEARFPAFAGGRDLWPCSIEKQFENATIALIQVQRCGPFVPVW